MALTKISGSVIKDSVSLSGNVSVGGTLTYQDVTNVDALGIGTFRTGIKVLAGQVDVGSNIKLGNAGVITATSFVGDGSGLTGTGPSLTGSTNNTIVTVTGANAIAGESNLTFDGDNTLAITGPEGGAARIDLISDEGDDAADKVRLVHTSGNEFKIQRTTSHTDSLAIDGSGNSQFAGQVKVSSSNASTVAFSVGDTNTGFYNAGSNIFGYSVSGSEKLRIGSDGVATLKNKLIIDDGTNGHLFLNNTSSENTIHSGTTGFAAYKNLVINAGQHIFKVSNTERFRIHSTGRVKIGNSGGTPDGKLHIDEIGTGDIVAELTANSPMFTYRNGSGSWFHAGKHPSDDAFVVTTGGTTTSSEKFRIGGNGWAYFNTTSNGTTNGNVGMRYNIGSANNANVAFHLTNRHRYSIWEHRQIGRAQERTAQMSCGETGSNQGIVYMYSSTANADVTGGVNLTNGATSWSANSDMRLKNKTGDILNALEDINKIEPIRFTWKYGPDNNPHVGVSAQSVENVVPEAIERGVDVERQREGDETEYMQVRYTELIPLSIAAIKELKSEVESLKAEIASLKSS